MVRLTDLVFGYRKQPLLFDGLNLRLNVGHIYGLLGKNGAGKTTLLKNMLGLAYPKSGTCRINGLDATKRLPACLRQVYLLPEEPYIPNHTAKRFVGLTSPFYPDFNGEDFERYLDEFDVPARQTLTKLSLGQQKKFMIAFALACHTPLLIMDEPTNGLDIPSKAQFRKVLAGAFDETRCMVISTHQVRDLDNLIDTVLILHDQQILLHANLDELTANLLFTTISPAEADSALYYEETYSGCRAILANAMQVESKPDLELLFNAVIKRKAALFDHLTTSEENG
ncbi:ABC transporter ATP-binding protein [Parapedobacter tibetensis]|uniref:ABC transporter ATP-binding protein n=1 Tax=Parapedobacter tibetensis TaxID=2972951 RepID=UPI00214DBC48|nr:ABC transporter ATP-binding protein [Parapedobacter tibetensis]